jgi:hypothetical protein
MKQYLEKIAVHGRYKTTFFAQGQAPTRKFGGTGGCSPDSAGTTEFTPNFTRPWQGLFQ